MTHNSLQQFRKSMIALLASDPALMTVADKLGIKFMLEGWDFVADGYSEIYIYKFSADQYAMIMKRGAEYVYEWSHPCDQSATTLKSAEAKCFASCVDNNS